MLKTYYKQVFWKKINVKFTFKMFKHTPGCFFNTQNWIISSAVEHSPHKRNVTGSIPV